MNVFFWTQCILVRLRLFVVCDPSWPPTTTLMYARTHYHAVSHIILSSLPTARWDWVILLKGTRISRGIWQNLCLYDRDNMYIASGRCVCVTELVIIWDACTVDRIHVFIGVQATVSLSRTVSETFSVEWWLDLEIWVRCHSRSLKMVQFESFGTVSIRVS